MSKTFELIHRNITMLLVACLLVFMSVSSYASLSPGTDSFVWEDKTGASDPDKPLKVYYYRPAEFGYRQSCSFEM